eukprot:CAMPEP_0118650780 /NCGR_PEP_ID=MMETSP0785-20121206/10429_1 /TAXON_ID=91992 /ORGANISM="Bolidomonas pacifica, Strain CCMP 1866" /LENGTH=387 /DNA_ID=CAMNT_0006543177 /DNA_START=102 /DNA_END=1262 /DNA_ORIENTATION=-
MSKITLLSSTKVSNATLWSLALHPTRSLAIVTGSPNDIQPNTKGGGFAAIYEISGGANGEDSNVPGLRLVQKLSHSISRTVRCCDFSPDGRLLSIGGYDGVVEIWSIDKAAGDDEEDEEEEEEGGEESAEGGDDGIGVEGSNYPIYRYCCSVTGQENEIKSCTFSQDSGLLCTTSRDKTQWIWDVQGCWEGMDPEVVSIGQHGGDVKCSRWTKRGTGLSAMVGSAGYDGICRWMEEDEEGDFQVQTTLESEEAGGYKGSGSKEEDKRPGWETIWDICVSSSGARMCLARGDGVVVVYDSQSSGWKLKGFAGEGSWETCYSVDLPRGGSSHFNVLACVGRGVKVYKETSLFESSEESERFKLDNEVQRGHEGEVFVGRWRKGGQGFVT